MASDECFKDPVASECHDRTVMRVRFVVVIRVGLESIVKASCIVVDVDGVEFCGRHHLPKIPQFHRLVFTIGENVSAIALAVNVSQSFSVTHEDTGFTPVTHGTPVPNSQCRVIRAGIENVRR